MGIITAAPFFNQKGMATKTYRTRVLKGLSLHIFIDGDTRTTVTFKRGCSIDSTATYITSNPKVQKALESLRSFNIDFYIEREELTQEEKDAMIAKDEPKIVNVEQAPEEEEKEVVDILDAQTFKNLVELRNALKDKGIDVSQITNVKAAENIAKKNGYNYTVEKNA